MLKNILIVGRKLASAALNFLIVYFETIALPMSWALGGTIMFTMYTELSNIFNGIVCLLVGLWQLGSMLYHHFLNPVLAILSLVLLERLPRLSLGQVWWALVPTVLYGLYDLHGNITGTIDGPYPFMRVYDQTIPETLTWFAIILGTDLLYAFLLWWLGGNGKKSKVGLKFRT